MGQTGELVDGGAGDLEALGLKAGELFLAGLERVEGLGGRTLGLLRLRMSARTWRCSRFDGVADSASSSAQKLNIAMPGCQ